MHFMSDNRLNTIHDINKYIKKGPMINVKKDKRILKIVEKFILGEKTKVRNIEFFLKPRKTGMRSPFHQDNFYWNISNKKALNVWIACSKPVKKMVECAISKNLTKTVWLNIFCPKNRVVLKKSLKLILKK